MNRILDDLGFNASDLLNVSFVFIVEGKQDKSRLPLLLRKYYSEITAPDGQPFPDRHYHHQQLHQHQNLRQLKVHEPDLSA